jgi:hypothetical protein
MQLVTVGTLDKINYTKDLANIFWGLGAFGGERATINPL